MNPLLGLFLALRTVQQALEDALAVLNWRYVTEPGRQAEAARVLGLSGDEMRAAHAYAADRYRFGRAHAWVDMLVTLGFLAAGGLRAVETASRKLAAPVGSGPVATGLAFFAVLGLLSAIYAVPFSLYFTFVIEERHGFNRQTLAGFFLDRLKGLAIGAVLGAPLLAAVLWLIGHAGPHW